MGPSVWRTWPPPGASARSAAIRNPDLIRRYVLRKLKDLRIFISCLPDHEPEALSAMEGAKGTQVAARIADFVLEQLGHRAPREDAISPDGKSPSLREARKMVGKGA